jgi:lactoylglutathione lyase
MTERNIIFTKLRLELFYKDIQKAADFYCSVLGFVKQKDAQDYISVSNGQVVLGLGLLSKLPSTHPLQLTFENERKGLGMEIVLETDDLDSCYNNIVSSGYPVKEDITQREWGSRDFRITDTEGYYIRIASDN